MWKTPVVFCLSSLSVLSVTPSIAADAYFDMKPTGVSLEWYQHQLDMDITQITTSLPGVPAAILDTVAAQTKARNDTDLINLRLDYQLRPYLNIFGAIGKVTDKATIGFSALAPGVPDMVTDNKGIAYSVGAVWSQQYDQLLASVNYVHSRLDLEDNSKAVVLNAAVPSLGLITDWGIVSASLVYQDIQAAYGGSVVVPTVGSVPVTVETENKDKLQVMAGYRARLAPDLFLQTDVGLNGQRQFRLQLTQRF